VEPAITELRSKGRVAPVLPPGLDRPEMVIDLVVAERNARRLASALDVRGIALRPQVKTHKSPALARLQVAAGAHGITVGNSRTKDIAPYLEGYAAIPAYPMPSSSA
jgi:hypothetical protein